MSPGTDPPPSHPPNRAVIWLFLLGLGVVVGPAAVLLTASSLGFFVLNAQGGSMRTALGLVVFFVVAIGIWYAAGRITGAICLRLGASPFVALALLAPAVALLGLGALALTEDTRVLIGYLVLVVNALVLIIVGIRNAEQSLIRQLRGPGTAS